MRNARSILKTTVFAAFCILAMAATAQAQNGNSYHNNNAVNDWTGWAYVDFATTTIAGHADTPTATFGGVSGLKYKFLQLDLGGLINNQQCFEVATTHPDFLPGDVADTRIWIVSGLGSFASPRGLNDDSNGTLFSTARVWLQGAPSSFVNLTVAAFSTGWNTAHYALLVRQIPATEANCTTNQSAPWVKVKNGTMTISANAF